MKTALDAFGRLDVAREQRGDPPRQEPPQDGRGDVGRRVAVHLKGTFLCTAGGAPRDGRPGRGRAHHQHDERVRDDGQFRAGELRAAKAGIYGLTRTAAIELQKHRITVNAIAPIAKTRMTEDLPMFQSGMDALTPEHIAPGGAVPGLGPVRGRTGHVLAVAGAADVHLQGHAEPRASSRTGRPPGQPQEIADHWDDRRAPARGGWWGRCRAVAEHGGQGRYSRLHARGSAPASPLRAGLRGSRF
jgi:NAD(P)-dependent dehydrogenase (short-subunit alcohol dehydrogenase family)